MFGFANGSCPEITNISPCGGASLGTVKSEAMSAKAALKQGRGPAAMSDPGLRIEVVTK